jgi:hypothetical protein
MEVDRWIAALFAKVGGKGSPERTIAYLAPRLDDLSPYWFTEDAIAGIWRDLRTLNSAERVRKALREFHMKQAPPRPQPISESEREASAWEDRKAWLRRDWDDPAGILRRVQACQGNVLLLRLLGKLVRQWAPQHLGFLPPHILEAIESDEAAPQDRHLRFGAEPAAFEPAPPAPPGPRHLDPAELDRINPLPNGRKRVDAASAAAAAAAPPVDADLWPAPADPAPSRGTAAA